MKSKNFFKSKNVPNLNNSDLQLRRYISPEDVKSRLPKQGGVGFLFHATDWKTLGFAFNNFQERSCELEEKLWNYPPFIASYIYQNEQVIGANIAIPVPIELWIRSLKGIKRFREQQFFPALKLAYKAGLNMVALGASTPYVCNYGKLPISFKKSLISPQVMEQLQRY